MASSSATLLPPTPRQQNDLLLHPHDLPPAYNQDDEDDDEREWRLAAETLKKWHRGAKIPFDSKTGGAFPQAISEDAVMEWKMLTVAGTAWAAPKPHKPKAPKPNETITITIDAASPNGPSPVTASGVFNGSGTDTRTSRSAGKSVHAKDLLTFDTGTVTVKDSGVRRTELDTTTCAKTPPT